MTLPKHPTTGVYAVFLKGTPYVYVGEGTDIPKRWRAHRDTWAWPNEVDYVVVREMPGESLAARRRTESALARLLKSRGYLTLSRTREEVLTSEWRAAASRATAIKYNALRGKQTLGEMRLRAATALTAKAAAQTACKHGHPRTPENIWAGGLPRLHVCKVCIKIRNRQYRTAVAARTHG